MHNKAFGLVVSDEFVSCLGRERFQVHSGNALYVDDLDADKIELLIGVAKFLTSQQASGFVYKFSLLKLWKTTSLSC